MRLPRRPIALSALALLLIATVTVLGARPADAAPVTSSGPLTLDSGVARFETHVASNGTKALAVWSKTSVNDRDHIWGVLMDANGSSKSAPFRISFNATDEFAPGVAWNGSEWLVVWAHNFKDNGSDIDVRAQRVSSTGSLIGIEIAVDAGLSLAEAPTVTAGPSGTFEVVYTEQAQTSSTTGFLQARKINSDGTLLGTEKTIRSGFLYRAPVVIWVPNAEWFVVAYLRDNVQAYAAFDVNGTFTGSQALGGGNASFTEPAEAGLATDGSRVFAVWNDGNVTGSWITLHPVNHSPAFDILPAMPQGAPKVAFNGAYLVVWEELGGDPFSVQLKGARFKADGTALDSTAAVVEDVAGNDGGQAIAPGTSAARTFTLVWENSLNGTTTFRGAGVTTAAK